MIISFDKSVNSPSGDGKIVNSFNCEFGYELISVVPYAYYLFKNNKLDKTISGKFSDPLYYFSPKHEINPEQRSWPNTKTMINSGIPNGSVHRSKLNTTQFIPPPYKEHYKNDEYVWEKPTICICNKYSMEWGESPINFFSLEMLRELFELLKNDYQIVYFGVGINKEIQDVKMLQLEDEKLCEEYDDVILFQNLLKESNLTWNELMLRIFANTDKFLTINGGYSVMASYFGGTNIIYCKRGSEIRPEVNSFNNWYNVFGGSNIISVRTYEGVLNEIKNNWKI